VKTSERQQSLWKRLQKGNGIAASVITRARSSVHIDGKARGNTIAPARKTASDVTYEIRDEKPQRLGSTLRDAIKSLK